MMQKNFHVKTTARDSLALGKYFTDISKRKVLTINEEASLCKQMEANNHQALDQLVCANLKFVVSIAKQYQGKGLLLADLISEGNIGLLMAAKKFDATKGFKFITFAVWWIRQSILKAISEQSRVVKLPKNQIVCISRIAKFSARFEQQHERLPVPAEIAEAMELDTRQVTDYLGRANQSLSLNAEISDDTPLVLLDRLGAECSTVEEFILKDASSSLFDHALRFLTIREKKVVKCFLGLDGEEAMRVDELALKMHLSPERIRQIRNTAFEKLKARAGYLKGMLSD